MKPMSLPAQDMQLAADGGSGDKLPQLPQEDIVLDPRLSAPERRELRFMETSDRTLADEKGQWTVLDVAQKTNSMKNLNRIMRNTDFNPRVLKAGCKNRIATADTWNMALRNAMQQMTRSPVVLPPDYRDYLREPSELQPQNHNRDIQEMAVWIEGRDTPAHPLPPETAQLANRVWEMAQAREDELEELKENALRAAGWE